LKNHTKKLHKKQNQVVCYDDSLNSTLSDSSDVGTASDTGGGGSAILSLFVDKKARVPTSSTTSVKTVLAGTGETPN